MIKIIINNSYTNSKRDYVSLAVYAAIWGVFFLFTIAIFSASLLIIMGVFKHWEETTLLHRFYYLVVASSRWAIGRMNLKALEI